MLKSLRLPPALFLTQFAPTSPHTSNTTTTRRPFTTTPTPKMPESVSQIDASRDPSVTKQYDSQSSTETKLQDFYALTDARNVSLLTTYRQDVGPVARSMAVAKRTGPDFLYLANANSTKFQDLAQNTVVNLSFQDSKTEDWVSVTGKAVTTRSDDPRIKEIWSKGVRYV